MIQTAVAESMILVSLRVEVLTTETVDAQLATAEGDSLPVKKS